MRASNVLRTTTHIIHGVSCLNEYEFPQKDYLRLTNKYDQAARLTRPMSIKTKMKNLIILFFLFPLVGNAQSEALPDPEPYFSAIIVDNIDTSIEWYTTILGFEVLNKVELTERGIAQANLKRGTIAMELIELDSAISRDELVTMNPDFKRIQGIFKIGFSVESFNDWVTFLETSNVTFNGSVVVDEQSGKKMVIIKDPDGNSIQLFEK